MKLEDIKKLERGDWFISGRHLLYVVAQCHSGVIYSSNSFLSLPESCMCIPYDKEYSFIHEDMKYVGKTKRNFFYWLLPLFIGQFVHPFTVPTRAQIMAAIETK